MNLSTEIIALIFLSIFADAADVDLANNTTFLLLLLLALSGTNTSGCCPGTTTFTSF